MDNWDIGSNLKDKYPYFYVLAEDKRSTVRHVIHGDGENQHRNLKWWRTLNKDENSLEEETLRKIQRIELKE